MEKSSVPVSNLSSVPDPQLHAVDQSAAPPTEPIPNTSCIQAPIPTADQYGSNSHDKSLPSSFSSSEDEEPPQKTLKNKKIKQNAKDQILLPTQSKIVSLNLLS